MRSFLTLFLVFCCNVSLFLTGAMQIAPALETKKDYIHDLYTHIQQADNLAFQKLLATNQVDINCRPVEFNYQTPFEYALQSALKEAKKYRYNVNPTLLWAIVVALSSAGVVMITGKKELLPLGLLSYVSFPLGFYYFFGYMASCHKRLSILSLLAKHKDMDFSQTTLDLNNPTTHELLATLRIDLITNPNHFFTRSDTFIRDAQSGKYDYLEKK